MIESRISTVGIGGVVGIINIEEYNADKPNHEQTVVDE